MYFVKDINSNIFVLYFSFCNGNIEKLYNILLIIGKFLFYVYLNVFLDFLGNICFRGDFIRNVYCRKESELRVLD